MTRGRRGEATYTGHNGAREISLRAIDKVKKSDASIQYRKHFDSQQVMRDCIEVGVCPFCGDDFKNLAAHTNRTHGIDRFELKEMAGIPKTRPACSKDFSADRSAAAKANVNPDHIRKLIVSPKPKKRTYSEAGKAVQAAKLRPYRGVASGFLRSMSPEEHAELRARAAATNSRRRLAKVADRDAEIVRRVHEGDLLADIAADLGIRTKTAKAALIRGGVTADLRSQAAFHPKRKAKSELSLAAGKRTRAANLERQKSERHQRWRELGRTWQAIEILAKEWGVTEKSVVDYLKRSGEAVPDGRQATRRRRAPKESGPRLKRWAELGKDWNAILVMSEELGMRPQAISQYLRNLGEMVPDGRKAAR
ncbi:hypothetical protein SEA_QUICKMATH_48 [Mycobacterium phage QuickMath]|uniref:Uncharacterized protein n=2 Tax=Cheoctovirus TaxID=1623281 RepID=A0A385DT90_9CAUD|nr:hypothetical protein SEA_KIMBERLIUM_49 [Mycobacterium phage Kimberlium]YP_009961771.1 hypothetical protein I5H83_gp048 [Mycobacterium phage QuickMath]AKU43127.1 hypothetical protein SEA_KIMBERLIUM_49 [Mycobacterium phage Kimberlium]AXQ61977.1 hypothetical protein SEA_QUICKMATH_48 [Mycobacterium phage QuickMath]